VGGRQKSSVAHRTVRKPSSRVTATVMLYSVILPIKASGAGIPESPFCHGKVPAQHQHACNIAVMLQA
jgi:hypothetical protein